jgi:hypothetical protein
MSVSLSGTSDGKAVNVSESYVVTSKGPPLSVNMSFTANATSESFGMSINPNGTLASISINGSTIPSQYVGQYGSLYASSLFFGFGFEVEYHDSLGNFTSPSIVHSTGTSTVTIGSVSVPVTTYTLNSSPESADYCGGKVTLNSFTLSEGMPAGSQFPLVTYLNVAGSGTSNGNSTSYNVTLKITNLVYS